MMKTFLLSSVLAISAFCLSAHAEGDKNNKVILFTSPVMTLGLGVMEAMQFLDQHPKVDATFAVEDLPEERLGMLMEKAKRDDDDPADIKMLDRWDAQVTKLEKDGMLGRMRDFMKGYFDMELSGVEGVEALDNGDEFNMVLDQGNRLADKFGVKARPMMVVVDVNSKRVTRYPLPTKFYEGVKSLEYLLDFSPDELGLSAQAE